MLRVGQGLTSFGSNLFSLYVLELFLRSSFPEGRTHIVVNLGGSKQELTSKGSSLPDG